MPATINFYDPAVKASFDPDDEPDATLDNVLTWSDRTLEGRHDYIQHLFPLPERSPVNPDAPIITKQVRDAFLQQPELRQNLRKAFGRMCSFYGMKYENETDEPTIRKGTTFDDNAEQTWLTSSDHNHLRITRIIRCMRLLGLETEARKFALALLDADTRGVVSSTSATYWCRAALWPLQKPPSHPREGLVQWLSKDDESAEQTDDTAALDRHISRRRLNA
ncbi:hypothetical protein LTR85_010069 [Meristemomyces frigidus]|nr:hypothetical protein LTR85_010069 [Meristemomyces frigidus]